MRGKIIIVLSGLLLCDAAWALGETNCSDAKGTLLRTEQEIWGANIVEWKYQGTKLSSTDVVELSDSRVELERWSRPSATGGLEWHQVFTMKVALSGGSTETVLCSSWVDDAID